LQVFESNIFSYICQPQYKKGMFQATINNAHTLSLNEAEQKEIEAAIKAGETTYQLEVEGKKLLAHISSVDLESNTIDVRINHNKYTVQLKTPADILVNKLGIVVAKSNKASMLKSPMPGLILKVLVAEGAQVKKGENLVILEAMKMENVFKAGADATVKHISVQQGQAVEKGQELITFE
jgi:biotin carboxyl carrier protein